MSAKLRKKLLKQLLKRDLIDGRDADICEYYMHYHPETWVDKVSSISNTLKPGFFKFLAEYEDLEYVQYVVLRKSKKLVDSFPLELVEKHRILPLDIRKTSIVVATCNPFKKIEHEVREKTGTKAKIKYAVATPNSIDKIIEEIIPKKEKSQSILEKIKKNLNL
ncbi:MAG: hypothetical protein KKD39_02000 [Candidatus Altiarchaeota archaeon]|nr:hypothetical protein [Candidatus Altiarchaeota archaeon]